jgi:hypothetical protein
LLAAERPSWAGVTTKPRPGSSHSWPASLVDVHDFDFLGLGLHFHLGQRYLEHALVIGGRDVVAIDVLRQ